MMARLFPRCLALLAVTVLGAVSARAETPTRVYGWGTNQYGQLSDGTAAIRETPAAMPGFPLGVSIVTASAGPGYMLAVGSDGRLYAWGANGSGQLGDGANARRDTPAPITGFPDGVSIVTASAGQGHVLAIGSDGRVYAWGRNTYGQLGDDTTTGRATPAPVTGFPSGVTLTAVSAGANHSMALGSDGRVYTWGDNRYKQSGDRTYGRGRLTPVPADLPRVGRMTAISAGSHTSFAVSVTGDLYAWGTSRSGELGSSPGTSTPYPEAVPGLPHTVIAVAAGEMHTLALLADGSVYAWGYNRYGQLGDGTEISRYQPGQVDLPAGVTFTSVAAGRFSSFALTADGTVYSWGDNRYAQLARRGANSRTLPAPVTSFPAGISITAMSSGPDSALGIGSDHKLYLWGRNERGELGFPAPTTRLAPVIAQGVPYGHTLASLSAGSYHVLAVDTAGTVLAWGRNSDGQVGDGSRQNAFAPMIVTGFPNGVTVKAVAAGDSHSLALGSDGRVYAWGANVCGRLGTGTAAPQLAPAPVTGFPDGVIITAIAAGSEHSLAAAADGAVYAWGRNAFGQLGDGTLSDRVHPVAVSGFPEGAVITAVSAGMDHSLALDSNGRVYAWGGNDEGQLGNGTNAPSRVPMTVAGLAPCIGISAGSYVSLAVSADGVLYAFGSNWTGQLGDGSGVERDHPTPVTGFPAGTVIRRAWAGRWHALALDADGNAYAWGNNRLGAVGDGTGADRLAPVPLAALPGAGPLIALGAGEDYSLALAATVPPPPTPSDVLRALRIAAGLSAGLVEDAHLNVTSAGPSRDRVDILDAVLLLRETAAE